MKDANAILEAIKTERLSSYEGKDTYEIGFLDGLDRTPYWQAEDKFRSKQAVRACPAVDAVPVIRCKDCEHYSQVLSGPYGFGSCAYCIYPTPDDFCSHAEPKEENHGRAD